MWRELRFYLLITDSDWPPLATSDLAHLSATLRQAGFTAQEQIDLLCKAPLFPRQVTSGAFCGKWLLDLGMSFFDENRQALDQELWVTSQSKLKVYHECVFDDSHRTSHCHISGPLNRFHKRMRMCSKFCCYFALRWCVLRCDSALSMFCLEGMPWGRDELTRPETVLAQDGW